MTTPLIHKLDKLMQLSPAEHQAILTLAGGRIRHLRPREDLVREDQRQRDLFIILDGWACRYKMLEDGRRQTLSILVGGELCDLDQHLLDRRDHGIATITALRAAEVPLATLQAVLAEHPRIGKALRWCALVDTSIEREWIVNLGQRNALERISHLLCELFYRMRMIDAVRDNRCDFPLTQADIADATGLTVVHVNRTLQELRRVGLISLAGRELVVNDEAALQHAGLFNTRYLHPEPPFPGNGGRGLS